MYKYLLTIVKAFMDDPFIKSKNVDLLQVLF